MIKIFKIIVMIGILKGQLVDYQTQIQPIFNENCTNCHGYSGGLALGSFEQLMAGGNSGDVVVPGDYQSSILWQRIDSGDMPPGGELSSSQIELIEDWITQGALEEALGVDIIKPIPGQYLLHQNYPNPFNPLTKISYYIPKYLFINIDIYDLKGYHIKSLFKGYLIKGTYSNVWDSTNNNGSKVSAGVYIYTLRSNAINKSKKMILLK